MVYEFSKAEPIGPGDEFARVADVYVVTNLEVSQDACPSRELLAAAERASATTRDILGRILRDGFLGEVRK